MTTSKISVGEWLVLLLQQHGVQHIFGIPGVHTVELYRGLARSSIRHITPRHEQGAGFMADGYARISGRVGVCLVITGPGVTNIATAMQQAKAESIPMLVIAGVNSFGDRDRGRGHLHEMSDQRAFAERVSIFAHSITHPLELPEVLDRAFAIFTSARPGPVFIEIPVAMMKENIAEDWIGHHQAPRTPPLPAALAVDTAKAMIDKLQHAKKPLIIIGKGAMPGGKSACAAALKIATQLDCPILPTIQARGLFPKEHPLVIIANGSLDCVRQCIESADCLLVIGSELGFTDFDIYNDGAMFVQPPCMLRIDIDAQQLSRGYTNDIGAVADATAALLQLADVANATTPPSPRTKAQSAASSVAAVHASIPALLRDAYPHYLSILESIQQQMPNAIFVGDSTQLVYAGNLAFTPGNEGAWFNSSIGFGTLGYALPAAIGAKIAEQSMSANQAPTRPVVAIIGDGGLQFTIGELATLAELQLPLSIVVWNNFGYGEIRAYMENYAIKPCGVNVKPPNFADIARAYGLEYARVSADDIANTLALSDKKQKTAIYEIVENSPN